MPDIQPGQAKANFLTRYFRKTRRIPPTWKWPLSFLGLYVLGFAYYYIYYVPRAQGDIINRSFRVLSLMGEQVRSAVENNALVLRTAALRKLGHMESPDDLDGAEPIPNERLQSTDCPSRKDNAEVWLSSQFNLTSVTFRTELERDHALCRWITLDAIVGPAARAVPAELFDEIIVSDVRGRVLFQKSQSEFRLTEIGSLLDDADLGLPAVQTPAAGIAEAAKSLLRVPPKSKATHTRIVDVTIGGERYKMLLHPIGWPMLEPNNETEEPFRLVLIGLIKNSRLESKAKSVDSHVLILIFCFVVIGLLTAWPYLKLRFLAPTERFRAREILMFALSVLAATQMITLLVLYSTQYYSKNSKIQLADLARDIATNLNKELEGALGDLQNLSKLPELARQGQAICSAIDPYSALDTDSRNAAALALTNASVANRQANLLASPAISPAIDEYPYFTQVFWIIKHPTMGGFQGPKWTVEQKTTPQTNAAPFSYFTQLSSGNLWSLDETSKLVDKAFVLDPTYSPNTGEYITVLAQSFQETPPPAPCLAASVMLTPLLSLNSPVMPPGFGFAVVDQEGTVRYHSDPNRNGRENIYREVDKESELRSAMLSSSSRFLELRYQGVDHFIYTLPLQSLKGAPWMLVVFQNASDREHFYLDVFLLTAACVFCFVLESAILIGAGGSILRRHLHTSWYWPEEQKIRTFNLLLIAGLLLLAAATVVYRAPPGCSALAVWFLPPAVVLLTSLAFLFHYRNFESITSAASGPGGSQRRRIFESVATTLLTRPFKDAKRAYLAALLVLVVTMGILPSLFFFRLAFNYSRIPSVADQQLRFAAALIRRNEKIRKRYRKMALPDHELFISKWIERNLDSYDLLWRHDPSGGFTEASFPKIAGDPVTPVFLNVTTLIPHPLSAAEGLEDAGAVPEALKQASRWKWGRGQTADILVMHDTQGAVPNIPADLQTFKPKMPAVTFLLLLVLVLFWVLWYALSHRFLMQLSEHKRWELFDSQADIVRNMVVVGWPRSGKSRDFAGRGDVVRVNIRERAHLDQWQLPEGLTANSTTVVLLDNFEYEMDNPEITAKKLWLLQELVRNPNVHVVILSTVDPMFYWFEDYLDPSSHIRTDHQDPSKHPVYTASTIFSSLENRAYPAPAPDQALDEERCQILWASCTQREKLALWQLAHDGAVNPKNRFALEHLYDRRIVEECHEGEGIFVIAHPDFKRFIQSDLPNRLVEKMQESESDTAWATTKRVLIMTAGAAILFFLVAWQDFWKAGLSEITGALAIGSTVATFLPNLINLASSLQGKGGSSANG